MRRLTRELVQSGVHPDDIKIWDYDPYKDAITHIRTATGHLLWTDDDQRRLEEDQK